MALSDTDFQQFLTAHNAFDVYTNSALSAKYFWNILRKKLEVDLPGAIGWVAVIVPDAGQPRLNLLKAINIVPDIVKVMTQVQTLDINDNLEQAFVLYSELLIGLLNTDNIATAYALLKDNVMTCKSMNHVLNRTQITSLLNCLSAAPQSVWLQYMETYCKNNLDSAYKVEQILQNTIWNAQSSNGIAKGFIQFMMSLDANTAGKMIDVYYQSGLPLISMIDRGLGNADAVIVTHKAFFADTVAPDLLLQALSGQFASDTASWQQAIEKVFFYSANPNLTQTIASLKVFGKVSIIGLLNLCIKYPQDGYQRLVQIASALQGKKMLTSLEALTTDNGKSMIDEMVWVNGSTLSVASSLINVAESRSVQNLCTNIVQALQDIFIQARPHLIETIEGLGTALDIYQDLSPSETVVYTDLLNELQKTDALTRTNILKSDNRHDIFQKLQLLSAPNASFPCLMAGILTIGSDNSLLNNMLTFMSKIFYLDKVNTLGIAIESLGSRDRARKLVLFLCQLDTFMSLMTKIADQNQANGILQSLCDADGDMPSTFMQICLNNSTEGDRLLQGLLYQASDQSYTLTTGFIQALTKSTTETTIMQTLVSFQYGNADPYRFVRILEQISPSHDLAEAKFMELLAEDDATRQTIIQNVYGLDGYMETFMIKMASDTRVGDILSQLIALKKKSETLYKAMLILFARVPDADFQQFGNLIESKMIQTNTYGDIMSALGDADFNKSLRFMQTVCNNPKFIEALHLAFNEEMEEEADLTVQFINAVYDKNIFIDAFDDLSILETKVLMRAFIKPDHRKGDRDAVYVDIIEGINSIRNKNCSEAILQALLYDDPTNRSAPVTACTHFIACFQHDEDLTRFAWLCDTDTYDASLITAIEKALMQAQSGKESNLYNLLQSMCAQKALLCILQSLTGRDVLLQEIFADSAAKIKDFYLYQAEIFLPLLCLYKQPGDFAKIVALRETIQNTVDAQQLLTALTDTQIDPCGKFLSAALCQLCDVTFDTHKLVALNDALSKIYNLKKYLLRFAARTQMSTQDIQRLIAWLMTDGNLYISDGVFNYHFQFPSEKGSVIEDACVYDWFLRLAS